MKRAVSRLAGALVGLVGLGAAAQTQPFQRDIDLVVFKPTPSLNGGIILEGAKTPAPGSYRFDFLLDLNFGLLSLSYGGTQQLGKLVPFRVDAHLMGAYQVLKRLELGVDLPVTLYQKDNFGLLAAQGFTQPGIHTAGLGNARLLPRVSLLEQANGAPVGLGVVAEFRLPTGDGGSFLAERGLTFAPRLTGERGFGRLRILADAGFRFRSGGQFLNLYVGNEFAAGAGVIYRLPDVWRLHQVEAMGELNLATPLNAPLTFSASQSLKTPLEALIGARAKWTRRWGAELDVGRGLGTNTGYGREDLRILASLRYDFDPTPEPQQPVETDRDHDGVPDKEDLCPDEPGSRELQGCPDRDGDQIPDNVDKCPDQPGPAENDGCPVEDAPLVSLESNRIRIRGSVLFETGKAIIQKQSFPLLDEVYGVLSKHPEIGTVRVDGHTDNTGTRQLNLDLSDRRAKAVAEYLVKKGIPRERLRSKGFGFDKPVATNDTVLGRAKNRRVEFTVFSGKTEMEETPREKITPAPTGAPAKAQEGLNPKPAETQKPAAPAGSSPPAKP